MRKGEIACNKQFVLFSQYFLPLWYLFSISNALQNVICNLFQFEPVSNFVERFNPLPQNTAFQRTYDIFNVENIVRKGEIACNKQFVLFSQYFLPLWYLFSISNAL